MRHEQYKVMLAVLRSLNRDNCMSFQQWHSFKYWKTWHMKSSLQDVPKASNVLLNKLFETRRLHVNANSAQERNDKSVIDIKPHKAGHMTTWLVCDTICNQLQYSVLSFKKKKKPKQITNEIKLWGFLFQSNPQSTRHVAGVAPNYFRLPAVL